MAINIQNGGSLNAIRESINTKALDKTGDVMSGNLSITNGTIRKSSSETTPALDFSSSNNLAVYGKNVFNNITVGRSTFSTQTIAGNGVYTHTITIGNNRNSHIVVRLKSNSTSSNIWNRGELFKSASGSFVYYLNFYDGSSIEGISASNSDLNYGDGGDIYESYIYWGGLTYPAISLNEDGSIITLNFRNNSTSSKTLTAYTIDWVAM